MSADAPKSAEALESADNVEPITGLTRSARGAEVEALIGGRYQIQRVLGIGGMACVYLASDTATGRELAVKRLTVRARDRGFEEAAALFVREFHTLLALSHPCVVEVYDYGVDELGPFYTMEHVQGGDLKELAPCAWRQACSLAFDVCSVLALLHSRRLVHGDVSPRNVRVARAGGRAKLIDFGALSSMGPCDKIIGTPAFVAPEVVSRLTSDARTDLYSLGGTLYYALTGQLPYPASDFGGLAQAWQSPPRPPSQLVSDVPEVLDALVLSLLAQDPVERPGTTYEVMERLCALSGLTPPDEPALAQAHLRTPSLQGRQEALQALQRLLSQTLEGHGGGGLIVGAAGEGRSRMLDEAVALAKTHGAVVLRVGAGVSLWEQLLESFPELTGKLFARRPSLASLSAAEGVRELRPSSALLSELTEVLFEISAQHPLVVAADDVQRLDHAALSLLVALAGAAADGGGRRLCVLASAERSARRVGQAVHEDDAHALLASECEIIQLWPLTAAETEQLLGSMFGDVPNLSLLSARVHERALGNPRASFDVLQYLMAERRIVYARGGWTLPSALSASDLPLSDAAAVQSRIANLPGYARCMLWAHALAPRAAFRREDYAIVIGLEEITGQRELDRAVIELLCERFLRYDGRRYGIAHPAAANLALNAAQSGEPQALERVQRGLAAYFRRIAGAALFVAKHLFAAGDAEQGLAEVLGVLSGIETTEQLVAAAQSRPSEAAAVLAQALDVAHEQARPEREIMCLEQWLLMLSPVVDSAYYARVGPSLRARLERDSGFCAYQALPDGSDRLAQAFTQAADAHARRGPAKQGLGPDQAIAWVARYVAVSIAIGSKTQDGELLASLPRLIEPFTGLSPLIDALWQNALAVCESSLHCKHVQACARWRGVLERLPSTSSADLQYVEYVRRAVMYALGMLEVRLGFGTVDDWTQQLDSDPAQAVNAMYLRKCLRLQAGDREGAEQCRKQAELLHLRSTAEQMFTSNLLLELSAHALARDVQGVKQCWDRIVPLAARYPGWVVAENLARGLFHQLIGEYEQALHAYEAGLRQVDLVRDAGAKVVLSWPAACAGYVETLNELGRFAQARTFAENVLRICSERDIDVAVHAVVRALALAEAKSGESAAACASARLERLLDEQRSLGIKGIQLAATYEARAKVALSLQDDKSYREFARLGAAEYHEAHTSSLSTRYTGWWTGARDAASCASDACFDTVQLRGASNVRGAGVLERELLASAAPDERARRALALLCDARAVQAGRLYLRTQLVAEHGEASFAADLSEHVRELLTGAETTRRTHGSALGPFERDTEQAWLLRSSEVGQAGEQSVLGVVVFPHAVAAPELMRVTRALKIVSSALQRGTDTPP